MDEAVTPREAFALLAEQAEDRIRRRLQALPAGAAAVSCRAGCAACCRQLVVVSPLEAFAIAAWVDERPALKGQFAAAREGHAAAVAARPALAAALHDMDRSGGQLDPEAGGALEVAFFQAGLPCPFLREDRCAIYPVRPFACREHFALSDPALCALDPDRVETPDTRLEFKTVAAVAGAQAFGFEDRLLALPAALEYAQEHRDQASARMPIGRFLALAALAERRIRGALAALMRLGKESESVKRET